MYAKDPANSISSIDSVWTIVAAQDDFQPLRPTCRNTTCKGYLCSMTCFFDCRIQSTQHHSKYIPPNTTLHWFAPQLLKAVRRRDNPSRERATFADILRKGDRVRGEIDNMKELRVRQSGIPTWTYTHSSNTALSCTRQLRWLRPLDKRHK